MPLVQAITGQFVAAFTLAVGRFLACGYAASSSSKWMAVHRRRDEECATTSSARPTDLVRSTPSPVPPGLAVPRAPLVFNSSRPLANLAVLVTSLTENR